MSIALGFPILMPNLDALDDRGFTRDYDFVTPASFLKKAQDGMLRASNLIGQAGQKQAASLRTIGELEAKGFETQADGFELSAKNVREAAEFNIGQEVIGAQRSVEDITRELQAFAAKSANDLKNIGLQNQLVDIRTAGLDLEREKTVLGGDLVRGQSRQEAATAQKQLQQTTTTELLALDKQVELARRGLGIDVSAAQDRISTEAGLAARDAQARNFFAQQQIELQNRIQDFQFQLDFRRENSSNMALAASRGVSVTNLLSVGSELAQQRAFQLEGLKNASGEALTSMANALDTIEQQKRLALQDLTNRQEQAILELEETERSETRRLQERQQQARQDINLSLTHQLQRLSLEEQFALDRLDLDNLELAVQRDSLALEQETLFRNMASAYADFSIETGRIHENLEARVHAIDFETKSEIIPLQQQAQAAVYNAQIARESAAMQADQAILNSQIEQQRIANQIAQQKLKIALGAAADLIPK